MSAPEYQPDFNDHRVGYCAHELCRQYDGKRCRLTGFQPHGVCEPWAIDASRDHRAMEAIRRCTGELTQTEDTEGNGFYFADVGSWGQAEDSDPAEAILKAYAIEVEHMKADPVQPEPVEPPSARCPICNLASNIHDEERLVRDHNDGFHCHDNIEPSATEPDRRTGRATD